MPERVVEQALEEWMSALDVVEDPIFIHDRDYRVIRCNKAYQIRAGVPFKEIIGRPYYELFPKMEGPLSHCSEAMERRNPVENHEEIRVGETLFRSRAYAINGSKGEYLYSVHLLENITRQRENEQKLRDSETFIKTVLDNLPVGIAVNTVEPAVAFTYMNDNFPKIYRTTRDKLNHPDAFWEAAYEDPVFRETIRNRVMENVRSGRIEQMHWDDIPITRRGGETTYINARNIPLPSKHSMISMVWDVTEHKRSEERLQEEKTFSETLIQNLPDIFFLIDREGRLQRWNRRFSLLFGISESDIKELQVMEFVHEEDRSQIAHKIEEVFDTGSAVAEARLLLVNGARTYALSGRRIETPQERYLIGFGIDITERKEAETQLRLERDFSERLVDTAPVIILVLDPGGNIVRYNRYMEELSGYALEETIGQPWFETFLPESDRESIRRVFAEAVGDIQIHGNINPILTKGGEARLIEWYAKTLKNPSGEVTGVLAIGMDVTRRQQTEEALRESEHRFKTIFDKANDGILLADTATKQFTAGNPKICEMLGYTPEELTTLGVENIHPPADLPHVLEQFGKQLRGEIDLAADLPVKRKDGSLFIADINSFPIVIEGREYLAGFFRDVTRRKETEQHLRESEERYRTLFETMLNGFAYCRMVFEEGRPSDFIYLEVNQSFEQQTGLKDVVGKHVSEVIPGILETDPGLIERYGRVASGGKPEQFEIYVESLEMWFFISVYCPKPEHFVAVFDVITERKQAETELKNELHRRRVLMESSRDGIAIINQHHRIVEANASFAQMLGYPPEEMAGLHTWDYEATMSEADIRKNFSNLSDTNLLIETRHRRKDGTQYDVEVSISGTVVGNEPMVFTISRDITRRKQAEAALERANRALRTLSAGNLALVKARSEEELLSRVADVIVTIGGYDLSAVCYAENDPDQTIRSVVWAGNAEEHYCSDMHLSWGDNEAGDLPIGQAIRTAKTQICHDVLHESAYRPWKEALISRGLVSVIALPLIEENKAFGALTIYSTRHDSFTNEEVELLEELSGDLAFGIIAQRTRAEHERHTILMRESLEQSIQAIAATLEARDPYTAGHQRRVAELSVAIASEMGMEKETIDGIRFAAMIHDLGKIHIPAEILSKPSRLTDIEYLMIQTHPQEGYNILKDIRFPWPIAQIILQHHERLDGSGYPQGLSGDQILPEAKIICVADVVEAMSSHRPYRPGLGLEPALEEIRRGRGSIYDSAIVDACLALFTEKGFDFSNAP